MNYLNGQDIASYSKDLFQQVDLGRKDMLVLIEVQQPAWYLVYGLGDCEPMRRITTPWPPC